MSREVAYEAVPVSTASGFLPVPSRPSVGKGAWSTAIIVADDMDKRVRRKHPNLTPMQEFLKESIDELDDGVHWTLEQLFDAAKSYDRKIVAKVSKINRGLVKAGKQKIKFSGTHDDANGVAAIHS